MKKVDIVALALLSVCSFAAGFAVAISSMMADKSELELSAKTARQDSLEAVVHDLEAKVEILNKYLVIKNLEYLEACELTHECK